MFYTKAKLQKKTPNGGIGREEYIEHLAEEFHTTVDIEAQEQVCANLANFAYDPVNYPFILKSNVLEIFLQSLSSVNTNLILYSIGGICNLSCEKKFQELICKEHHINMIYNLLKIENQTDTVVNALTTLYFLMENIRSSLINLEKDHKCINNLQSSTNPRIEKLVKLLMKQIRKEENKSEDKIS